MATAKAAIRTKLKVENSASPPAFVTVAMVSDINGIKLSAETPDTTNHDNEDGYREFIQTLKNGGDVTCKCFWDPNNATHNEAVDGLVGLFNSGDLRNWQILYPVTPPKQWSFTGLVSGVGTMAPVAGALECDITIKVSGKPELETPS